MRSRQRPTLRHNRFQPSPLGTPAEVACTHRASRCSMSARKASKLLRQRLPLSPCVRLCPLFAQPQLLLVPAHKLVAETVRCSPQSHSHSHRTLLNLVWARSITVQRPNFRSVRSMSRMANQLGVRPDARDPHGLSPGVRPRPSYLHLLVSAVFQFGFPPSQHAAGFAQSSGVRSCCRRGPPTPSVLTKLGFRFSPGKSDARLARC